MSLAARTTQLNAKTCLTDWIRQHPALALVSLVCLFEWSVLVPRAADARGLLPFHLPGGLELVAGWGPAMAAVIVTGAVSGTAGLKGLFNRFLVWKVGAGWYALVTFGTAAVILGGLALNRLLGSKLH